MTREEKSQVIDDLTDKLTDNSIVYVADISGLNAGETSDLRKACFKHDVHLTLVKNTLLSKAMKNSSKEFGGLFSTLKGNTSILLSETGNTPAKIIKEFRKKSNKPILKGAYIEEVIYIGDEQLGTLVNIKSKDEQIGDVICLLQSPAKNIVLSLRSGGQLLSGIIKTLSEK